MLSMARRYYNDVAEKLRSIPSFETCYKVSGIYNMLSTTELVMTIEISA